MCVMGATKPAAPAWQLRFAEAELLPRWLEQLNQSGKGRSLARSPGAPHEGMPAPPPPRQLRVWAGSWNAGGAGPPYDELPPDALRRWLRPEGAEEACDVYAVGFQEIDELRERPGSGESPRRGRALAPTPTPNPAATPSTHPSLPSDQVRAWRSSCWRRSAPSTRPSRPCCAAATA